MIKLNNFLYDFLYSNHAIFWISIIIFFYNIFIIIFGTPLLLGLGISAYFVVFILIYLKHIGKIKFNLKICDIPEVGEKVIITKEFYYNGVFLKQPERGQGAKPWFNTINIDEIWTITEIIKFKEDYLITFKKNNLVISVDYIPSRKYWKSLNTIRDEKLKKLKV